LVFSREFSRKFLGFFLGIFLGTQAISDGGIPSKKVVKKRIIKKKMGSKQEITEIPGIFPGFSWNLHGNYLLEFPGIFLINPFLNSSEKIPPRIGADAPHSLPRRALQTPTPPQLEPIRAAPLLHHHKRRQGDANRGILRRENEGDVAQSAADPGVPHGKIDTAEDPEELEGRRKFG
jgi:hypothetical protein